MAYNKVKWSRSAVLNLWVMGQIQPAEKRHLGCWEFGGRGAMTVLIASPLLPNFQTHGKPVVPNDMALLTRSLVYGVQGQANTSLNPIGGWGWCTGPRPYTDPMHGSSLWTGSALLKQPKGPRGWAPLVQIVDMHIIKASVCHLFFQQIQLRDQR